MAEFSLLYGQTKNIYTDRRPQTVEGPGPALHPRMEGSAAPPDDDAPFLLKPLSGITIEFFEMSGGTYLAGEDEVFDMLVTQAWFDANPVPNGRRVFILREFPGRPFGNVFARFGIKPTAQARIDASILGSFDPATAPPLNPPDGFTVGEWYYRATRVYSPSFIPSELKKEKSNAQTFGKADRQLLLNVGGAHYLPFEIEASDVLPKKFKITREPSFSADPVNDLTLSSGTKVKAFVKPRPAVFKMTVAGYADLPEPFNEPDSFDVAGVNENFAFAERLNIRLDTLERRATNVEATRAMARHFSDRIGGNAKAVESFNNAKSRLDNAAVEVMDAFRPVYALPFPRYFVAEEPTEIAFIYSGEFFINAASVVWQGELCGAIESKGEVFYFWAVNDTWLPVSGDPLDTIRGSLSLPSLELEPLRIYIGADDSSSANRNPTETDFHLVPDTRPEFPPSYNVKKVDLGAKPRRFQT